MLSNDYYKLDPRRQLETINPDDFSALAEDMKKSFICTIKTLEDFGTGLRRPVQADSSVLWVRVDIYTWLVYI